jgi:hypothetical protein
MDARSFRNGLGGHIRVHHHRRIRRAVDASIAVDTFADSAASMSVAPPIAHVWISVDGAVYLNKQLTTIPQLDAALTRLADASGVVWYSRENADADPGPAQDKSIKAVLDVIIAHRLPVRLLPNDPDGEPPTPTATAS